MTRLLPTLLLAAAFAAGGTWLLTRPGGGDESLDLGAAFAQEDGAEVDTSTVQDMTMGDPNAPVTVIEYASFTCPHCRSFHEELYPELKADYIDTGEVQLIYREVYFDLPALWASMVARCGGEERFFGISEMIYDQQPQWTQGDGNAIAAALRTIGLSAGITQEQMDACFTDGAKAETLIAWYEENSEADDVTSTPTFIINGEKLEGRWPDELLPAIDAALGE